MHVYCQVSRYALQYNIRQFRNHLGAHVILAPAVKSNAYGHDMCLSAHAFIDAGADWLCVHSVAEGVQLRQNSIQVPIYVFGPLDLEQTMDIIEYRLQVVVSSMKQIHALIACIPHATVETSIIQPIQTIHWHLGHDTTRFQYRLQPIRFHHHLHGGLPSN